MPDTAWKANERAVAKRLNGQRVGPTGREGSDVAHPLFSVECKERKELPEWLVRAMGQSRRAARPEQIPIVVIHQLGRHHDSDLVMLRLADFEDLAGRLPIGKETS